MSRSVLARAAMLSLSIGASTIACTPGTESGHVAAPSDLPRRDDAKAARFAAKARSAIARRDGEKAVRLAERAVAANPSDAGGRLLLGQSYLMIGRFASADTAFRDAATLSPGLPRARFGAALAVIAQGRGTEARALLAGLDSQVSDADLGLAYALSGDRGRGIAMLTAVVRAGKSDARVRQNLAFAFALDGKWGEARGMAMQDIGPDRINDQIAGWASLANAGDVGRQVAAVLGTAPVASDPGVPLELALAAPPVVALAPPAPAPAPTSTLAIVAIPAPAMPTQPALMQGKAAPAVAMTSVAVPALLAPADRPDATPRSFVRAAALRRVAPGPIWRTVRSGGFVVQLGAYGRAGAIETAWSRASRLSPRLASLSAVKGHTSVSGATLVRLSIGNFADRGDAADLCGQIKARGGACFVRAAGNDAPWQWARREDGTRLS